MLHQLWNFGRHKHLILACSGGVDSMAIADFYHRGNKNFSLAYFHHNTPQADAMQKIVEDWSKANNRKLHIGNLSKSKPKELSPEEFWRNERYEFLLSLGSDIITAHHLNDAVEQYLFSTLNGTTRLIKSYQDFTVGGWRRTVYRPFLTNTKEELISWCSRHSVKWFEDNSNQDVHYPRNRIRYNIIPEDLKVNPGLFKVIKKKYLNAQ